jgi:hypothetical protein
MARPPRSKVGAADFLLLTLSGGALDVLELEAQARVVGLLNESQSITHSKVSRSQKNLSAYDP